MVEEGIKNNPESTKAQAQPGWWKKESRETKKAPKHKHSLDGAARNGLVASSTSRQWFLLRLVAHNPSYGWHYPWLLLICSTFTNCICWLQATPPKDTKHYWQYHNSEDAQKNHIKETLLQPTLREDTTYIWQYIGRFFSSNIIPCTHFHRHAIVPSTYHDKSMRKFNSHTFRFPQFCALSPLFEETTDISFQDESGSENDPFFGLLRQN